MRLPRPHEPRPPAPVGDRGLLATALVLAALVGAFQVVTPLYSYGWSSGADVVEIVVAPWARLQAVVAGLVAVGAVVLAARRPALATAVAVAPFALLPWTLWFVYGWYLAVVAVAVVGALRSWRSALLPYVAALGLAAVYCAGDLVAYTPIGPVTSGSPPPFRGLTFGLYVLWVTGAVVVALAAGSRRRARQREAQAREQQAQAAVVDTLARERARMARDLHDVVAHHVSLIAVRAESAPFTHPDLGEDARRVLAEVADDARAALGELREALAVLRRTDDDAPAADRRPQPVATDVDRLVAEACAAGQRVRVVGEWGTVPDTVGYVLYRSVQEGLTNARRHAPGATVDLERTTTRGDVGVRLSQPLVHPVPAVRDGRGLVGMRERVEALGGTVVTDVTADRFVLEVRLPVAGAGDAARPVPAGATVSGAAPGAASSGDAPRDPA